MDTLEFVVSLGSDRSGNDVTFDWQTVEGTAVSSVAQHSVADFVTIPVTPATIFGRAAVGDCGRGV